MTNAPSWVPPDSSPPEPDPSSSVPMDTPPPPSAPVPVRTNRLAIAALTTGLAGMVPFAAGFAIAALVQTRRRGEKGRSLAIGALTASAAWAVAVAAVAVAMAGGSSSSAEHVQTRASALREGDCFTGAAINDTDLVTIVPCTQPHESEVIARSPLPNEPYPGPEKLYLQAKELCTKRGLYLQKSRYHENLDPRLLGPDQKRWWKGDREVTCLMHYTGTGALTSPLAATVDPNLKGYAALSIGECIPKWDNKDSYTAVVPCTEPHRAEVVATFELPFGEPPWTYPGTESVDRQARRGCEKRSKKIFADRPPPPAKLVLAYRAPDESAWDRQSRLVLCALKVADGTLKQPLVPR
ncbi:DUF4190 domain-containing protein [Actinomadura bangladeshensis]|uniref:Septum formation-related domain-containing protein n=1 Tax=Actinomadura bangladeshensis TaxID=453573 RepID=A0A4R4N117_9ACTN|nr:DUF4190 domain-containing protein [Actinomadura bangladeshensis]TDC02318.1 hypothetical protein E1284_39535 [Actinomadura bangladeshensis]